MSLISLCSVVQGRSYTFRKHADQFESPWMVGKSTVVSSKWMLSGLYMVAKVISIREPEFYACDVRGDKNEHNTRLKD